MAANPKQRPYKPLISHQGGITLITTALIHFQCGEIVPLCEHQTFICLDLFFRSEKKEKNFSKVLKNITNQNHCQYVPFEIKISTPKKRYI